jgi:hypothetical protein
MKRALIFGVFTSLAAFGQQYTNTTCTINGNFVSCDSWTHGTQPQKTGSDKTTVVYVYPKSEDHFWRDFNRARLNADTEDCRNTPDRFMADRYKLLHSMDDIFNINSKSDPLFAKEQQEQWRKTVESKPSVPDNWRIDNENDLRECVAAKERTFQATLRFLQRHPDIVVGTEGHPSADEVALTRYIADHFPLHRFDEITLDEDEAAYKALR